MDESTGNASSAQHSLQHTPRELEAHSSLGTPDVSVVHHPTADPTPLPGRDPATTRELRRVRRAIAQTCPKVPGIGGVERRHPRVLPFFGVPGNPARKDTGSAPPLRLAASPGSKRPGTARPTSRVRRADSRWPGQRVRAYVGVQGFSRRWFRAKPSSVLPAGGRTWEPPARAGAVNSWQMLQPLDIHRHDVPVWTVL